MYPRLFVGAVLAVGFSLLLSSSEGRDLSPSAVPVRATYFASKSIFLSTIAEQESGMVDERGDAFADGPNIFSLDTCYSFDEFASDDGNTYRVSLERLAYYVARAKTDLTHVPSKAWMPELINVEDELLDDLVQNASIDYELDHFFERLAEEINLRQFETGKRSFFVVSHPEGCGSGEHFVTFKHPPATDVQYLGNTAYMVCSASVPTPPGYCEWNTYTGAQLYIGGRFVARIVGGPVKHFDLSGETPGDIEIELN